MSYIYLFELYEKIEQRLETIIQISSESFQHPEEVYFSKGQQDMLRELTTYLEQHMNPKLPRLLAKKLKDKAGR